MELPKGTFKGLARVIAPLWFWMAAGWAAYPYMMLKITDDIGEAMNAGEVRLFSIIMTTTCIGFGIGLAVYGFTGKDANDDEIKALAIAPALCPYCGARVSGDMTECQVCHNSIPN
ncbi:MAG: hypothetical protein R6W91_02970 [Thermoplasmata archaeon]